MYYFNIFSNNNHISLIDYVCINFFVIWSQNEKKIESKKLFIVWVVKQRHSLTINSQTKITFDSWIYEMLFKWLFMKTSCLTPLSTPGHFPLVYSDIWYMFIVQWYLIHVHRSLICKFFVGRGCVCFIFVSRALMPCTLQSTMLCT